MLLKWYQLNRKEKLEAEKTFLTLITKTAINSYDDLEFYGYLIFDRAFRLKYLRKLKYIRSNNTIIINRI